MGAPGLSSASQAAGRRRTDRHGSPGDAGAPAEGAEGPGEKGKTCPRPDGKWMDPKNHFKEIREQRWRGSIFGNIYQKY